MVEVAAPRLPPWAAGLALTARFLLARPAARSTLTGEVLSALVTRAQAGDEAALAELYGWSRESVLRFFDRKLGDRHAAEDAAQEIAERLLRRLSDYSPARGVPFENWVFRIARNELVDELRRRKRLTVTDPHEIAERCDLQRCAPDVAERVERWAIERALARLPERQRQVLTLRLIGDLDTDEIAEVLGITEYAVGQAQARGKRALRRYLDPSPASMRVLRAPMGRRATVPPVLRARRFALLAA